MSAVKAFPLTEPTALPTWRTADAEALDARAENIQLAVLALERLDGMFAERGELTAHVGNALNLLRVEEDNLRRRACRIRGGA